MSIDHQSLNLLGVNSGSTQYTVDAQFASMRGLALIGNIQWQAGFLRERSSFHFPAEFALYPSQKCFHLLFDGYIIIILIP